MEFQAQSSIVLKRFDDPNEKNEVKTIMQLAPPRKTFLENSDETNKHPPTSYIETIVHLFKGNIGPGLFAMGNAFMNGGLVVAPILTVAIAVISVHCQHLLIKSSEKMRELRNDDLCADYAETVEQCFMNGPPKLQKWSKVMKNIVNLFICVTQLGFCCIYFVFIGTNMKQIFDSFSINLNVHIVILVAFIPVLLTSLILNLKLLTPVSLFANVCMITGLGITLYFALKDGLPNVQERALYTKPSQVALFFGTAIFAFEGIALVLPLKNSMRDSKQFDSPLGVLNVGMFFVTALFLFAGFAGYIKWGDDVGGSLTLNLENSLLAQAVKIMVSTGVLLGYPLQFFIAIQIILPKFIEKFHLQDRPILGEILLRIGLVLVTLGIAELVPALDLFISLIGSLCSTALALVFPPMIELLSRHKDNKCLEGLIILKNIVILLLALLGFATGTYESLTQIIIHFGETNDQRV